MATLSIVIPAPDDVAALEQTLISVLENRPAESEIIVVLGCEYDDPWNIRDEVRFVRAPVGCGLVGCINLGFASSSAEFVHVLSSGWRATEGWTDAAMEHFVFDDVGAVVPIGLSFTDRTRVVSAGVRYSRGGRRSVVVPPQGKPITKDSVIASAPLLEVGFWRTRCFDGVGPGFSTTCGTTYADVDMGVSLSHAGYRTVREHLSYVLAPETEPARSNSFLQGLHAERFFWRSLSGLSLLPILFSLVSHLLEFVRHSLASAPQAIFPMLVGRFVALMQFGAYLPRYRQLKALRQSRQSAANSTIRMDGPHAFIGRPHTSQSSSPLRRSA